MYGPGNCSPYVRLNKRILPKPSNGRHQSENAIPERKRIFSFILNILAADYFFPSVLTCMVLLFTTRLVMCTKKVSKVIFDFMTTSIIFNALAKLPHTVYCHIDIWILQIVLSIHFFKAIVISSFEWFKSSKKKDTFALCDEQILI